MYTTPETSWPSFFDDCLGGLDAQVPNDDTFNPLIFDDMFPTTTNQADTTFSSVFPELQQPGKALSPMPWDFSTPFAASQPAAIPQTVSEPQIKLEQNPFSTSMDYILPTTSTATTSGTIQTPPISRSTTPESASSLQQPATPPSTTTRKSTNPIKRKTSSSSTASTSAPDTRTASDRRKAAHTRIERRYRQKMNAKFAALSDLLPRRSVIAAELGPRGSTSSSASDVEDDDEDEDERNGNAKPKKTSVLSRAAEYIVLMRRKEEEARAREEGLRLRVQWLEGRVRAMEGGQRGSMGGMQGMDFGGLFASG